MSRRFDAVLSIPAVGVVTTDGRTLDRETGYVGQVLPGNIPELFAPGVVASGHFEHSVPAFSPAGDDVYWSAFFFSLSPEVVQDFLVRVPGGLQR